MAKVHTYTKYVEEPNKVVTLHLASEGEEVVGCEEQCNGSWKEVGAMVETISQTLENSRPGSKFPLFHRIGGEVPVSTLEVSLLEEELKKIKSALKKMPLSESRVVSFRRGKAEVKQLTEKDLKAFRGNYQKKTDNVAKNLYESHQLPLDLHMKMCKLAKKSGTGLVWRVFESKQLKKNKAKSPKKELVTAAAKA